MEERTFKDEAMFYLEYVPKFTFHLAENLKSLWKNFLEREKEALVIERYALVNRKLNEKHGDFDQQKSVLEGYSGIIPALEIDNSTASRILKLGKDEDELFKREVKARTEPYNHLTKSPDTEKIIAEKQEELEGQGLGEIIGIVEKEEVQDDGRREEEERT